MFAGRPSAQPRRNMSVSRTAIWGHDGGACHCPRSGTQSRLSRNCSRIASGRYSSVGLRGAQTEDYDTRWMRLECAAGTCGKAYSPLGGATRCRAFLECECQGRAPLLVVQSFGRLPSVRQHVHCRGIVAGTVVQNSISDSRLACVLVLTAPVRQPPEPRRLGLDLGRRDALEPPPASTRSPVGQELSR